MNASISPLSSALQQMQSLASQAAGTVQSGPVVPEIGGPDDSGPSGAVSAGTFADALRSSVNDISGAQMKAANEGKAFELGSPNVSLNDVMVDAQKANVGLQFGLQVRNKLVAAYTDIMNITV
jgi:flagellar hook-basal body complex protein FliE